MPPDYVELCWYTSASFLRLHTKWVLKRGISKLKQSLLADETITCAYTRTSLRGPITYLKGGPPTGVVITITRTFPSPHA